MINWAELEKREQGRREKVIDWASNKDDGKSKGAKTDKINMFLIWVLIMFSLFIDFS
jgi:hypothetical protein